jgi:hypothetical protein
VPFRLLGFAVDPRRAAELYSRTFSHYASIGAETTVACLDASLWTGDEARRCAVLIGAHRLLLLDYPVTELATGAGQTVLIDILLAVRPHIVVAASEPAVLREAADLAFAQARRQAASAGLPAKLYYPSSTLAPSSITTLVSTPGGSEGFLRAYPQPWITGVVERDLLAGLRYVDEPPSEALAA